MFALITVLLLSYLVGSVPSSLWVGRLWKSVDVREHGSGNAGATNAFRVLGWKAGIVVLLLDFAKGFLATAVISQLAWEIGSGPVAPIAWEANSFLLISCGVMAVLGHMYPIYASFNGGKGAATAAGMLYGIEPVSITITLVIFIGVILITRYVSLGSMVASFCYPLTQFAMVWIFDWVIDPSVLIFSSALALFIIVKHHANIRRLWNGTESKVVLCPTPDPAEEKEEPEP
ncbi:MAG: glycerol-3-phosphate 1-O-acyltransferase PlsY [Balneolaceae bacterium]